MSIPTWLFWVVLGWALVSTGLLIFRSRKMPFVDYGHRCFAVKSESAAKTTAWVLSLGDLLEKFTFDAGQTRQMLFSDGATVLMWNEPPTTLCTNALSLAVENPEQAAKRAVDMLRMDGFVTNKRCGVVPEVGDDLIIVESSAFDGWVLVFRRHMLSMGKPPNKRTLIV